MSKSRSLDPVPTFEECAAAVAKAVVARRTRQADHAPETVLGVTLDPSPGCDGWWLVGRVFDEVVDAEFSIWYMPGEQCSKGRVGLSIRPSDPEAVQFTAN